MPRLPPPLPPPLAPITCDARTVEAPRDLRVELVRRRPALDDHLNAQWDVGWMEVR